jgi:DNA polymerase-3 subunit alpha
MVKPMAFVHLHNHSYYSLLQSPSSPAALVKKAKEQNASALALTDNGTMYGAIEFYKACKSEGIKAILGMEAYIAPRGLHKKENKSDGRPWSLVLLAENQTGYENLLKLASIANIEGMYYKPRIDLELLEKHKEGLIALSAGFNGEIANAVLEGKNDEEITEIIEKHLKIFGKDNFFLELSYHPNLAGQVELNEHLIKLAKKLKLNTVVGQNAYYASSDEAEAQDILTCIATNRLFDDDRATLIDEDYSLIPAEEIEEYFQETPEAIENTQKIADRCNVTFDLGVYHIPEFLPPEGHAAKTPIDYFRHECVEGLKKRYTEFNEHLKKINWQDLNKSTVDNSDNFNKEDFEVKEEPFLGENIAKRFEFEFAVIKQMGFESYFLIVWDYIKWAKENNVLVGPGRGSGAGSIIAYALEITNLEPLRFDLLFERFLNPERISMPDFDIDFQDNKRGEVIRYVTEKYGADHVAQISTFGTMAARAAVKDVGRVLGLSFQEMNDFAKLIPDRPGTKLKEAWEESSELRANVEENKDLKKVWEIATKLEGCVRHISVHACAVVISKEPLNKYSAIQHPPKDNTTIISQFSAKPLEDLGLLKMDFLGLKNLTILDRACQIIKRKHAKNIDLDLIPLDDKKTYEVFQKGQTTGVFQFESSGMKRYLKDLKPTVFDDIVAMAALYRPGPLNSGMTDSFVKRKNGKEAILYPHPSMESSLKDTYGVVVYQEQIMNLSKIMAGFTGGQADTLRKAMGKKIKELMDKLKEEFILGCQKNDINQKLAEEVWHGWEEFAKYGFNKSHSACYALVAYQTAYLKAYYPTEFMAALLTSDQANMDRVAIEISECRQMDIEVLAPSVNESLKGFTVVKNRQIRFGLNAIKNLGESCVEAIITARGQENIPFSSLEDFLKRVEITQLNRKNLEALILSGALDELGERKEMSFNLENLIEFAKEDHNKMSSGQIGLFDFGGETNEASALHLEKCKAATLSQRLNWEKEYLGLFVSAHPLAGLENYWSEKYDCISDINAETVGKTIKLAGTVNGLRIMRTKKDDKMAVFVLSTPKGKVDITVFPKIYKTCSIKLKEEALAIVTGKVDLRNSEIQIIAEKIVMKDLEDLREEAKNKNLYNPETSHIKEYALPSITEEEVKDANRKPWILEIPNGTNREKLETMKVLFEKNPGKTEIILQFPNRQKINIPQKVNVTKVLKSHVLQVLNAT